MGLYFVVLVAVIVFSSLNGSNVAGSRVIKSVLTNVDHSVAIDTSEIKVLPQRFLRSEKPTEGDEERMFSAMLSFLKKIKKLFQSRENVELQSWLKARLSTDDVFKILQLDEAGDKLLSNPNLKRWAAFVEKKIGNPPELMMVMKLRTQYDDATLARMFEFGTKTKGTRKMAKKLQDAQFVRWFLDGKWPNEIIDDVFKVPLGASWTKTDDVQPIWAKYSKYFEKYKPNWRDLQ